MSALARTLAITTLSALCASAPALAQAQTPTPYHELSLQTFRQDRRLQESVDPNNIDYPRLQATLCLATNEQRVKQGKAALPVHPALMAAAQRYARRMSDKNFFAHQDPHDETAKTPTQRAQKMGVVNAAIAENIAGSFLRPQTTYLALADGLITQWMNSKGHRANILADNGKEMGCGVYIDPSKKNTINIRAVQKFQWFRAVKLAPGSPYAQPPVVSTNATTTEPPRTTTADARPTTVAPPRTTPPTGDTDSPQEPTSARVDASGLTLSNFRKAPALKRKVDFRAVDAEALQVAVTFVLNEARVRDQRKPLAPHPALMFASQRYADRMGDKKFFSHEDPHDPATRTRDDRARHAGVTNPHVMQVVNQFIVVPDGQSYLELAEAIVEEWTRAPRRKQSLMSADARQVGHGVHFTRNADGTYTLKSVLVSQWFEDIITSK